MHRPQLVTWTTHTAETTTLLDYRKLYTYMCNIVTEFYLYSIVYINSRLDVTFSVHHHFRISNFITDDTDNYAQGTNHDYIGSFGRIPNEPKIKEENMDKRVHNDLNKFC